MNLINRMNERLKGWRVYAISLLIALPDILNGLGGVDFATIWPNSGAKVGTYLMIARLVAAPLIMNLRRASHDEPEAKGAE